MRDIMIKIGTCGYRYYKPGKDWEDNYESKLQVYSHTFPCVELNKTFFKLPMVKTAERWREEVYDDFEFTMKAWQALTHTTDSPSWSKNKEYLTADQRKNFGYLRPNEEVLNAWKETKKIAEALEAKVVVIQTPPSFECTEENKENMFEFFENIDKGELEIAWDPRGEWTDNEDEISKICNEFGLIHIVDIMRKRPVSEHDISYVRLHGLNENIYDYDYNYSKQELMKLAGRLKGLDREFETVYCMFNNFEMFENANSLIKILEK
ncbi:MAG: DUF72 domain-containing protein [Candidatus Saliniplasma sp.]